MSTAKAPAAPSDRICEKKKKKTFFKRQARARCFFEDPPPPPTHTHMGKEILL